MAHQLYVLQVLTFNLLEDRMMTKMDPQDQVSAHGQQRRHTGARTCLGLLRNQEILDDDMIDLLPSQNLGQWIGISGESRIRT